MIVPATNMKDYPTIAKTYKKGEPIFLENNGVNEAVLLSMEDYEDLILQQLLDEAADDIANGRVYTHEEVFDRLEKKALKRLKQQGAN